MATTLTPKQREAIKLFYQQIADAKQTFNESTDNGRIRSHLAWLSYYEVKQHAKAELSVRVPRLSLVTDFWHHAYYNTLEDALESAWTKKAEADSLTQGDLLNEDKPKTKTKKKGKKHKARAVS